MNGREINLRKKIKEILDFWHENGFPSREGYKAAAADLIKWKELEGASGIWTKPPLMITATLDDGLGQGLQLIHLFSEVAGLRTEPLGLMRPPEFIIEACNNHRPELLGLTVLQFDSEDNLTRICRTIPETTKVIAGGPVFPGDPDLAERAGVHFVAKNAAVFLRFLLDYQKR